MAEWVVFEWRTGIAWKVTPPTWRNARREAAMAGIGHQPFRAEEAARLRNAWAHGRMAQVERDRKGLA